MTTDETRELMLIYASGQAEPAERDHARGLLQAGDAEAAGLLAEALTVLADVSVSLDPVMPSPTVRVRLGRLLDAAVPPAPGAVPVSPMTSAPVVEPGLAAAVPPPPPPPPAPPTLPAPPVGRWPWALAGGLVAAVVVTAVAAAVYPWSQAAELADLRVEAEALTHAAATARTERDAVRGELARLTDAAEAAQALAERDAVRLADKASRAQEVARSALASYNETSHGYREARGRSDDLERRLDALQTALGRPGLRVVPLAGTDAQPESGARLLWDAAGGQVYFFAHGLIPAGEGLDYQLWVVTQGGEKISVGVFDADGRGTAALRKTIDLPADDLAAVAVTDEPEGVSPQPTGAFHLLGEF